MAIWKLRKPARAYLPFDNLMSKLFDIYGVDDLEEWLTPTEALVHSPYLLANIRDACRRIIKAIQQGENICVSYDIDADGITAGTIAVRYLRHFTDKVSYIYSQRDDGHGVGNQFVPEDTDLLIVVDSSTNSTAVCESLKCDGVDIIIIDHHPLTQENPHALIVNNQIDQYPNKELSGAGMVYKVCQVLDDMYSQDFHTEYIDLAGVGIYGDVMSMTSPENRWFVYNALKNIKNPGLKAILKANKVELSQVNSQTIGFTIAPIINACARMSSIEVMIELLLEDNPERCLGLAKEATKLNSERKQITKKLFKQAEKTLDTSHAIIIHVNRDKKGDDEKGFNGLLATMIADKYQKPALVAGCRDGICKGSARSLKGILLKSIFQKINMFQLLEGHQLAFGVEFRESDINNIHRIMDSKLKNIQEEEIVYDLELDLEDIDFELIEEYQDFNFLAGKDCYTTKVLIRGLEVLERVAMGKNNDTVKFKCVGLDTVKFRTNADIYGIDVKEGDRIDVIGTLAINRFYHWGLRELLVTKQLYIEDFKKHGQI